MISLRDEPWLVGDPSDLIGGTSFRIRIKLEDHQHRRCTNQRSAY